MTTHYLRHFFHPAAIAVIGASERLGSVGRRVLENLRRAGFGGRLYAVNPKYRTVCGQHSYRKIGDIDEPVDLAVIACPGRLLPDVMRQCAVHGVRAAIVLSGGTAALGESAAKQQAVFAELRRRYGIRIMGPDCLGVIRPSARLNATNSSASALPGKLALVSRSGALCTATLDWANARKIGFSTVVSLGEATDVEFGDVLDYLATDGETRSILLHVEGISQPRRFMSGLRAAARLKPVIVMKAGRHREAARLASSRSGAAVGADDVFDAALARAGAVRVQSVDQLFAAAAALSAGHRAIGDRLAIVANGGGPAVVAADRAVDLRLDLATLSEASRNKLQKLLGRHQHVDNPLDLRPGATPETYGRALEILLADPEVDGVLAMYAPQPAGEPAEVAAAVLDAGKRSSKPLLTSWLGETQVQQAKERLSGSRVPHFDTPEAGVEAYSYLAQYRRNQILLMQVPGAMAFRPEPSIDNAALMIEAAIEEGRETLSEMESKAVLTAFDIPVVRTLEARTVNDALMLAESVGYPVAMKISSPDIPYKAAIGGVRLDIDSPQAVRAAFNDLTVAAQRARPDARIAGVTIERMHGKPQGRELLVGISTDPVFGPVVVLGAGGRMMELVRDRAIGLPPLNTIIAREVIRRSYVAPLLKESPERPAADEEALVRILLQLSEMICKLPQIRELEINPLMLDDSGALALDARFKIGPPPTGSERYPHMAISPYPMHLVIRRPLKDGTEVTIRPIRPEDAEMEQDFVQRLSAESKYFRFMETVSELSTSMLVRFTQIDYDREMALVATREHNGGEQQIGVARYVTLPDGETCEFAIAISDEVQGQGLGSMLMRRLIEVAAGEGLKTMQGDVLANNTKMLGLMRHLGFSIRPSRDDYNVRIVRKALQPQDGA